MSDMRMMRLFSCLFLFALALAALDVSGKWTGSTELKMPEGDTRTYPLHLEVSQKGQDVSGTIGREVEERIEIQNGKIQGPKLIFDVIPPESGYPVKFELVIGEGRLEGQLKGQTDSGPIAGKVTLSRAD